MIAGDTSALVAIAFAEQEGEAFLQAIKIADKALVSTVSVVKARMLIDGRRGQRAVILMDDLLRLLTFELVAPAAREMDAAYAALVAFGKGSGHPAGISSLANGLSRPTPICACADISGSAMGGGFAVRPVLTRRLPKRR
jgi:ribonuclease VapC